MPAVFHKSVSRQSLRCEQKYAICLIALLLPQGVWAAEGRKETPSAQGMRSVSKVTWNVTDTGYRGIWYMNNPTPEEEFKYKYSGGLGTYCDYHQPMAVYSRQANKTFFCYGGAAVNDDRRLMHMVSYYDHLTGEVPRPTCLLDKHTGDAHDNPVISIDKAGHLWIFSSSHGLPRPSYIHRSKRPFDIREFELVETVRHEEDRSIAIDNFSYPQFWFDSDAGFISFFTRYRYPVARTSCYMTSRDGINWSAWQRLAAIGEGHYQTSAICEGKIGTVMNYHPQGKGLNWRTNLYYLESTDQGKTWQTADGSPLTLPLTEVANPALVFDYESRDTLVYLKDFVFDKDRRPIIVYGISQGYQPGPQNSPRELRLARWNGSSWKDSAIAPIDHNYDSASLYLEEEAWRLIAPTAPGPQPNYAGGEMVLWTSSDQGTTWQKKRQLTFDSPRNHTYARRPVNAHPDFYAIWADGDSQRPSPSWLYFCNREGDVFQLPRAIDGETAKPELIRPASKTADAR